MNRKGRSKSEWLSLIMECRKSGLTDLEWCRRNGINHYTFGSAVKRLRRESVTIPSRARLGCVDLTVAAKNDVVKVDIVNDPSPEPNLPVALNPAVDSPTASSIIVCLKAGEIRIENSADPTLVSCVLRTIGGLSC